MEQWILDYPFKKETITTQYYNETKKGKEYVAVLTYNAYTEEFSIYEVNNEDKSLLLLGKGKSPTKLEEKFIGQNKASEGYKIKRPKK